MSSFPQTKTFLHPVISSLYVIFVVSFLNKMCCASESCACIRERQHSIRIIGDWCCKHELDNVGNLHHPLMERWSGYDRQLDGFEDLCDVVLF